MAGFKGLVLLLLAALRLPIGVGANHGGLGFLAVEKHQPGAAFVGADFIDAIVFRIAAFLTFLSFRILSTWPMIERTFMIFL